MRSVVLAGLFVLAGCDDGKKENLLETVTAELSAMESESAATATAAPSPPSAAISEKRFQALGTEPFWSIEIVGSRLLYTSPEQQAAVAIAAHMEGMSKHGTGGLKYVGRMDGKTVVLMIEPGTCSDGMSDTVYPYKASFMWGDQTQQGCARAK